MTLDSPFFIVLLSLALRSKEHDICAVLKEFIENRVGRLASDSRLHHEADETDERRADLEPDRPQTDLHRLDRGRQIADVAVCRQGQEIVAGTGWQCAGSSSLTTPISRWR